MTVKLIKLLKVKALCFYDKGVPNKVIYINDISQFIGNDRGTTIYIKQCTKDSKKDYTSNSVFVEISLKEILYAIQRDVQKEEVEEEEAVEETEKKNIANEIHNLYEKVCNRCISTFPRNEIEDAINYLDTATEESLRNGKLLSIITEVLWTLEGTSRTHLFKILLQKYLLVNNVDLKETIITIVNSLIYYIPRTDGTKIVTALFGEEPYYPAELATVWDYFMN